MAAFLLWCLCSCLFLGFGIYCFFAKKAVGFWANARPFEVVDIRGYNRACGRLWIGYSLILAALGLPLLAGQNAAPVLLSVLGTVADTLGLILIYVLKIEPRYRKK